MIAYCGFGLEEFDGKLQPEIGFRIFPNFWGRGIATEAATVCASHARTHFRIEHYLGFAHPRNSASRRVLEKLGMRLVGDSHFHGGPVVVYQSNNSPELRCSPHFRE